MLSSEIGLLLVMLSKRSFVYKLKSKELRGGGVGGGGGGALLYSFLIFKVFCCFIVYFYCTFSFFVNAFD